MRLRPAPRRTRLCALAAGLAAAGALTLTAPASAVPAQADVTATLRVTITDGDSVMTQTAGVHTCHSGFSVGRAKDISVTVPAGQWVQVFSSHGCYDAINISGATIETEGQVISFTL
ncbi:hypothetical protein J7F01_32630 [Streptomyces sp. ISL-22]|uniref:hypothetical protein n=1 Tax=unclassified Streptomyces TaxID=2593676 RepID=UPI001BED0385|nr:MULTISPECIES: hypothetical protein [unclassified Streptomyces]MBT2419322.1 hypothetical protein [Streptomyces sp. ISL-24]MBT2436818.1 hypothetical protein [Streptomyces sp. ISL-22]